MTHQFSLKLVDFLLHSILFSVISSVIGFRYSRLSSFAFCCCVGRAAGSSSSGGWLGFRIGFTISGLFSFWRHFDERKRKTRNWCVVTWHENEKSVEMVGRNFTSVLSSTRNKTASGAMSTEGTKEKKDKKRKTLEAGLEDVDMADVTSKVESTARLMPKVLCLTGVVEEESKEGKG